MIDQIIFEVILEAVLKEITALMPFLNWPVINPLFRFVTGKIASKIFEQLSWHVMFVFIGFDTENEQQLYEKAEKTLEQNPGAKFAQDQFRNTLRQLVHLGMPANSSR